MTNNEWKFFFEISRETLGRGDWDPFLSNSWCAYTTFDSLRNGVHYWSCGLPEKCELLEDRTIDGGLWRQSFRYQDLAHIIIPATFYWERFVDNKFQAAWKHQDISLLSIKLNNANIEHRITELLIELKVY